MIDQSVNGSIMLNYFKVVHLTSAHSRFDVRIFFKECLSLKEANYKVSLIVADGKGNEIKDGICIFDVGKPKGRIERMLATTIHMFSKACDLDADIYHLHDPELILIGLELKRMGKKVVFDAHEDLPKQTLSKPYLNKTGLILLSHILKFFEKVVCRYFDAIVAATPFICNKFLKINKNTIDVNNFPILGELESSVPWSEKRNQVCYIGGIDAIRGIKELIGAMALINTDSKLCLAGNFSDDKFAIEMKTQKGWRQVNEVGFIDRNGVKNVMKESVAGLVTLHPIINYLDSLPIKMFEYMAAGLPVVASDFPLWREIIEKNHCGICVNPLDSAAIAKAIDWLVEQPVESENMGKNGKAAVYKEYNWQNEQKKLLRLYNRLLEI